jgi:hypothetical protein
MRRRAVAALILTAAVVLPASHANAQSPAGQTSRGWARVSLFGQAATTAFDEGPSREFGELVGTFALESPRGDSTRFEYDVDLRLAGYPSSTGRSNRVSIYDASVTARLARGTIALRGGQMWLNELGALGSVGGFLVERRQAGPRKNRWRAGMFGGLEPEILEAGYVSGIRKVGGYVALDGERARRHVLGYVQVRNSGLIERSVLLLSNFLPLGDKVFVYQAAEWDLRGPGGQGRGALTYLFANGRYSPSRRLEIQGTISRGRSIDARTITHDQLNGRPVSQRAIEGLLFESVGGRVTVSVVTNVRVYGGYSRDRNNREDAATGRTTFGAFASNLFGTGLDLTVSDSRLERGDGNSSDAWYASVGRSLGGRLYLSGEYSSSLAVVRFVGFDGLVLENRPRTNRFAASAIINASRGTSVVVTAERTADRSSAEVRLLSGLIYRF